MRSHLAFRNERPQRRLSMAFWFCAATFFASLTATDAQSSSPAMFSRDAAGDATLAIPGQGVQFDLHTSSTVFNGTRDDQFVLGYNVRPDGSRYNLAEPQIRLALEANYNDGLKHYMEYNLDMVTPDLVHARRWMYLKVDRSASMTGDWVFWGNGFYLQQYNSPFNDAPSEYLALDASGILRLTSVSSQPAQLQINTTDATGYPGSYAGLSFQRGSNSKWLVNNKGSNGDTLAIVGASTEVASFAQSGAFTSKGQRTAVTTKNSAYNVSAADCDVRVDCTSFAVAVSLPPATGSGQLFRLKKIDSSKNPATISCSGGDTMDGAHTRVLAQPNAAMTLVDGAAGQWDKF